MNQPFVSVVTPFRNTAAYLAECIESVLGQSYSNFEYILVDNQSSDGSTQIAQSYARRDPRIRLLHRTKTLTQVENYNGALAEISDASLYCKIVQADDSIFPDCLKLMIQTFERSESIGLVGAYDLKAGAVRGARFPFRPSPISGKETAKLYLRTGIFPFGSPTTVMYRSALIRNHYPFFEEFRLHEDTEKCLQILESWDFGFVYQVLSFIRTGNESISGAFRDYYPNSLDRYIVVQRFAGKFFDQCEAIALQKESKSDYYEVLVRAAFRFRESSFWQHHKNGLRTLNQKIDWTYLVSKMIGALLWMAINPGNTVTRIFRRMLGKGGGSNAAKEQMKSGSQL